MRVHQGGTAERKTTIDRDHKLAIKRQGKLLDISRGAVNYRPRAISLYRQTSMNRIDLLDPELNCSGAQMLPNLLRPVGHRIGRSKVSRLMRHEIEASYP